MKLRIAIWLPGGIGGGHFSQGQPVISKTIERLADTYDVMVFSYHPSNAGYRPQAFQLVTAPRIPGLFRWMWLIGKFFRYHFNRSFSTLYAFWGFPAGFIIVILGKLLGRPTIIHLQGGEVASVPEIRYGTFRKPVYKFLSLWAYKRATHLIALTHFQHKHLEAAGLKRPVHVIPFGTDLQLFKARQWTYDKDRELRCLHIANLTPVKDQLTLIRAFAQIISKKAAQLRVVGFDTFNNELIRICAELGIKAHVKFFPPQPHHSIPEFFAWADVFVLTSMYEGQGVVLNEAAASGVLLAGTSVGLLDDLGPAAAIVVNVKDHLNLGNQILTVASNNIEATDKINRARRWAEQHDWEWTIREIKKLIDPDQPTE